MFKGFMVSGNKGIWSVLKLPFLWVQNVCLPTFNNFSEKIKQSLWCEFTVIVTVNGIKMEQVIGGWICSRAKYTVNQCFCANVIDLCVILHPYVLGWCNTLLTFLFTTASLQIMPGCKLQLPLAETTWLEAMKRFTLPIIATTVLMDIGVCLHSTKSHSPSQWTPATKPKTHPQAQICEGFQT